MIIAFAGVQGQGQTFMDWSFNFLQGKDTYWNYQDGEQPLASNPVTNMNAHNHNKNHPQSENEIKNFLSQARHRQKTNDGIITFYPFIEYHDKMIGTIGGMNKLLIEEKVKQFWIKPTRPYPYFFERTGRSKQRVLEMIKEWLKVDHEDMKIIREMLSFRIHGSRKKWMEEVEALHAGIDKNIDITFTDVQWQYDTESCMEKIFENVGKHIDKKRIEPWRLFISEWRHKLDKMVQWYERDAPLIAKTIVDNGDLDLEPFNLDYLREATVMSMTMLNHGKRLLLPDENFPKNTKELNKFLK